MKTLILREITILILIAALATLLYYVFFGIDLSVSNPYEELIKEPKRVLLFSDITARAFLPLYLAFNLVRLIYTRFRHVYMVVQTVLACLLIVFFLCLFYQFLVENTFEPAEAGWTIYPPLTSVPIMNVEQGMAMERSKKIVIFLIATFGILTVGIAATAVILRKRPCRT